MIINKQIIMEQVIKTKRTLVFLAFGIVLLIVFALFINKPNNALGNRSALEIKTTAVATTSPNYMTAGNATTTVTRFVNAADQVDYNLHWVASSTRSMINWRFEQSNDNVDYYPMGVDTNANATTTVVTNSANVFSMRFASSTEGSSNNDDRMLRHISVKDLATKYLRLVVWIPAGTEQASSSALWVESTVKRQNF